MSKPIFSYIVKHTSTSARLKELYVSSWTRTYLPCVFAGQRQVDDLLSSVNRALQVAARKFSFRAIAFAPGWNGSFPTIAQHYTWIDNTWISTPDLRLKSTVLTGKRTLVYWSAGRLLSLGTSVRFQMTTLSMIAVRPRSISSQGCDSCCVQLHLLTPFPSILQYTNKQVT